MIDATPYVANEKGNLKLHVYTYYDKVLERFNEPIANRDEPSFVREGLRGTLTKGKGVELKGLILLYIGTFDCETGKFDLFDFMRGFGVNTNLIPYIVLDKSLCAPRDLIMQALLKINEKHPDYIQQYVENMDLRHKRFLYACYPNELKLCSCEDSECGHSVNFKKYSDDPDACFVCDLKKVFNND